MRLVQIQVDTEQLKRAEESLRGIPGGAEQAMRSSIFRARQHLWTQSRREVRKKYDISDKKIRAERSARMTYRYSPGVGVEAGVDFMGNKITLHKFNRASPKERVDQRKTIAVYTQKTYPKSMNGHITPVHPSIAAKAHQYRDSPVETFRHAFVAQMDSGHVGIFERDKGKTGFDSNLPIHELKGDAFAQMVGEKSVRDSLAQDAIDTFEKQLNHEIERILEGYGMK